MAATRKQYSGFTLAELLISLMIIAEIATFTIPKIIMAQQASQKIAVFKETISTISGLAYTANTLNDSTYLASHINAVKVCSSNATTEGCWAHTNGVGSESTEPGFILHNGATIAGFNGYTSFMDWNGAQGPNTWGDDQITWLSVTTKAADAGVLLVPVVCGAGLLPM